MSEQVPGPRAAIYTFTDNLSPGREDRRSSRNQYSNFSMPPSRGKRDAASPPLRVILAENLRKYRLEKGLSQTDLAERAGLRTRRIVALEKAQRLARVSTIEALAKALEIEPWRLLAKK